MRKLVLILLLCLCLSISGAAGAEVSWRDLYEVELTESNLRLLFPGNWVGFLGEQQGDYATYVFHDETDEEIERPVNIISLPKEGNTPEWVQALLYEAEYLKYYDDTDTFTVKSQTDVDRMNAILAQHKDFPEQALFIDDGDRYIVLMMRMPGAKERAYGEEIDMIVRSVALIDNEYSPRHVKEGIVTEQVKGGLSITGYTGKAARMDIPIELPQKVVEIGEKAFYEQSIQFLSFPRTVTRIGAYAFSGCNYLREVAFSEGLVEIGAGAFESCFFLKRMELPSTVERIGASAFWGCMYVEEMVLSASLQEIETNAFALMRSLQSIKVPAANKHFTTVDGVLMTKDGTRLIVCPAGEAKTTYTVPDGVEEIDPMAFADAYGLTELVFPESLRAIGDFAFLGQQNLVRVVIPEGVTELGQGLFSGAANLTIYGVPGSAAQTYAEQQDIAFADLATLE